MRRRLAKLAPQIGFLDAIRAELPEDGIFVDEVTQIGFAARLLLPVYKPRTFLSPGYQDNLGWGFATALGAQHARPRRPGALDLRRRRLSVYLERACHRHAPWHSADRRGVQRWRIRQRAAHPGGALRQPSDRKRSRQSRLRALCAELRRRGGAARTARRSCALHSGERSSAAAGPR